MKSILIDALYEAGKIQKENFKKAVTIELKESISSIVTEVDMICDKIIVETIRREFPSHNILTEESGLTFNQSKYTWVIDPLDGTSNFAAGIPWFGILIALFENNQPIMAGAYLPIEDSLYFAESGKGAFVNGKRLVIDNAKLKNSLFGFAIDYTDDVDFLEYGMKLYRFLIRNTRNIRCTNSLVDLIMVADGRIGGTINMHTKIWDIAAPWLIIKEAGGILKHLINGELEFDLNESGICKNYPIMAGSVSILGEFEMGLKVSLSNHHF